MHLKIERNKKLVRLRDKLGWSFSKIGREFNISKVRAHEVYHREKQTLTQPIDTLNE